jgi:hypothetical protein
MKISSLKIPAVVALVLGAGTSANAAMSVPRANGESGIVLVACARGWYRGTDGQCYLVGMRSGPRRWYGEYPNHRLPPRRDDAPNGGPPYQGGGPRRPYDD